MRIRNFDIEEPRNEQFFNKLCKDLHDRTPVPDLGLEVSLKELFHKNVPARTLSIPSRGLHVYVVMHGPEKGETLEVMLVNTTQSEVPDPEVLRRLGIPNVRLTQLEVISRMVMDFFLDFSHIAIRQQIIDTVYDRIIGHPDLHLNAYADFHNRNDIACQGGLFRTVAGNIVKK
jgi:hypothetical protein